MSACLRVFVVAFAVAVAGVVASPAQAGPDSKASAARPKPAAKAKKAPAKSRQPVRKEKSIVIDEADEISGVRASAGGNTLWGRTTPVQTTLIRLRRHFIPEIIKSGEDL